MPKVIFVDSFGTAIEVNGRLGDNAMMIAVGANLRGIDGDCGGLLACATCHVYVDEPLLKKLAPISADEEDLLDSLGQKRRANSRLSCQITVTDELDGLILHTPERQGR